MVDVRLFAGVDVGASATKVALLDAGGRVVGRAVSTSGIDFAAASLEAMNAALENAGALRETICCTVSTGYGRKNVDFADAHRTEIACHARGAFSFFEQAMTVVDIGGQDNKIIRVDAKGALLDFKMNRKCAAGTGAFLEEIVRRMGVRLEEMESLARQSTQEIEIGSFCTVFSATEVLGLIRQGVKAPDLARGAFRSVVRRVTEMAPLIGQVTATGGVVAHNPIVVELLSEVISAPVRVPPDPQLSGAVGAGLYAIDSHFDKEKRRA